MKKTEKNLEGDVTQLTDIRELIAILTDMKQEISMHWTCHLDKKPEVGTPNEVFHIFYYNLSRNHFTLQTWVWITLINCKKNPSWKTNSIFKSMIEN